MKKLILICGLFFTYTLLFAQEEGGILSTPAEIIKIMEDSELIYLIEPTEKEFFAPDRSAILSSNMLYQTTVDGALVPKEYEWDEETSKIIDEAEAFFMEKKYAKALQGYQKALELEPTCYFLMTYIGQMYESLENLDSAMKWYRAAIKGNYFDYMAHWFLADAYKDCGKTDKAINEITIAHILNRNNPRILKSLKKIYQLKNIRYSNWTFTPQCQVDSIDEKNVKITIVTEMTKEWMAYAFAKAVWLYEPGYRESKIAQGGSIISAEFEALTGVAVALSDESIKLHPDLKALDLAIKKKTFDEYMFYEVLLLDYPDLVYYSTPKLIENIKDYVLKVRKKV